MLGGVDAALEWLTGNKIPVGETISGVRIRDGFYAKPNWVPAGMEGVCRPSTYTASDHRPTTSVPLYKASVAGATDGAVTDLMAKGAIKLEKIATIDLPRKPEWLGY